MGIDFDAPQALLLLIPAPAYVRAGSRLAPVVALLPSSRAAS